MLGGEVRGDKEWVKAILGDCAKKLQLGREGSGELWMALNGGVAQLDPCNGSVILLW
jgi:hypothetical protein